jgi:hypothetical protein
MPTEPGGAYSADGGTWRAPAMRRRSWFDAGLFRGAGRPSLPSSCGSAAEDQLEGGVFDPIGYLLRAHEPFLPAFIIHPAYIGSVQHATVVLFLE